jgi:hypothetical protein
MAINSLNYRFGSLVCPFAQIQVAAQQQENNINNNNNAGIPTDVGTGAAR